MTQINNEIKCKYEGMMSYINILNRNLSEIIFYYENKNGVIICHQMCNEMTEFLYQLLFYY